MRRPRRERGEGRTGCILWLAFAGLVAYVLILAVPAKVAIGQFVDAMQEEATFAASRGNAQITQELMEKADELKIPLKKEELLVTRTRESITIEVHTVLPVPFFGGLWTWVMPIDRVVGRPLVSM
jgi:type III secretion system FlhB-like substrate exporter